MYVTQQMDEEIVKWIQYDNKLKEYNEKIKRLREEKEQLSEQIFEHYDIDETKDAERLPRFNIEPLNTKLWVHKQNHYESLTYKFLAECLQSYFDSPEKAGEVIDFIRDKRSLVTKVSLKRETS